ncbi:hypothetical protein FQA47_022052, partial [Oryzias melastigma]
TTLSIYQFGNQTALGLKYSSISSASTVVNNKEIDFLVADQPVLEYYKDITGCRLSGYGVRLGTTQECSSQGKRRRRSAKYNKKDTTFLSMGWST